MSDSSKKKKVVVTTKKNEDINPTVSTRSNPTKAMKSSGNLVFGKDNFRLMIGGIIVIAIGMLLMTGGHMPSPEVWDDNIIYSTRRTLIAPIVILLGLGIEFYAIIRK